MILLLLDSSHRDESNEYKIIKIQLVVIEITGVCSLKFLKNTPEMINKQTPCMTYTYIVRDPILVFNNSILYKKFFSFAALIKYYKIKNIYLNWIIKC